MDAVILEQEYFSPEEVQKRFSLSRATFYRLLSEGKFEAVKIGRATRVPAHSIRAFFSALPKRQAGEWQGSRKG